MSAWRGASRPRGAGIVMLAGPRYLGKTIALRRYLYLLWRRYQAGEDVGRPYLIGPGWKPPPDGVYWGHDD